MAGKATGKSAAKPGDEAQADGATVRDIAGLRRHAAACRACPLWQPATQVVFGEGPGMATVMLVGEQPGDREDLAGRPFVGPAGQLLDRALAEAGIDRDRLYVTNAVKHFKFAPRGKRRLHKTPDMPEIAACRWWLAQEMRVVRPGLVMALGGTAVRALFGRALPIGRNRGHALALPDGTAAAVTVHPSYLLRLPDASARAREYGRFVDDLRRIADIA